MKTPKEWNWEHTQICANDPAVHGQLLPTPQMVKFLARVQADALKEAAKIIGLWTKRAAKYRNPKRWHFNAPRDFWRRENAAMEIEFCRIELEQAINGQKQANGPDQRPGD